jgi:hypothetical protein
MLKRLLVASLLGGALFGGCATSGTSSRAFSGTAGPVRWDVVDIGQVVAADDSGRRWTYTIVLTNTGTSTIRFRSYERGSRAAQLASGALHTSPFERTLAPGAETRLNALDTWQLGRGNATTFGGSSILGTLTVERRFRAQDESGGEVTVPVIVHLDRGVGKVAPRRTGVRRPPSRAVPVDTLGSVAGTWRGYYRSRNDAFDVPLEVSLRPDGTFQAAENDPVTNRFSGRVRVQSGRLAWSQNRDTGTLTLHEDGGRRILVGPFGGPRDDGGTFAADLWLEGGPPAPAARPTAYAPAPAPGALAPAPGPRWPPAVRDAFAAYITDPKYTDFNAFAADRGSGAWDLPLAASAMDRAPYEYGKRGSRCEVYAVGDVVLESASPERRAAVLLGGTELTWVRTEEMTGAWSREDPLLSGVIPRASRTPIRQPSG